MNNRYSARILIYPDSSANDNNQNLVSVDQKNLGSGSNSNHPKDFEDHLLRTNLPTEIQNQNDRKHESHDYINLRPASNSDLNQSPRKSHERTNSAKKIEIDRNNHESNILLTDIARNDGTETFSNKIERDFVHQNSKEEIPQVEQPFQNNTISAQEQPKSIKVQIQKYSDIGIRNTIGQNINNSPNHQYNISSGQKPPSVQNNEIHAVIDQTPPAKIVQFNANNRNSFETSGYRPDQNESVDTIQNLSAFLNDHVKNQAKSSDNNQSNNFLNVANNRNSFTGNQPAYNIFDPNPPIKKVPSAKSLLHQTMLNELPNDPQILKTNIISKEQDIKFLKEKLDLLNETHRGSIMKQSFTSALQIQEFKIEQLTRNIKAERNENNYLIKQLATLKTELDRVINTNSQKMYDARIAFDKETRALMEKKESQIVLESPNMNNPEVVALVAKYKSFLIRDETNMMKNFLKTKQ